jgi:hypothetical protein
MDTAAIFGSGHRRAAMACPGAVVVPEDLTIPTAGFDMWLGFQQSGLILNTP